MDYSLPGSSVHGIFQARIMEWDTCHTLEVSPKYLYCHIFIYICVLYFSSSLDVILRDFIHIGLFALHHITHWAMWTRMWIGRGQLKWLPCSQGWELVLHASETLPRVSSPLVSLVSELESSTDSGKWRNLRKPICLPTCLTSFNFKLSHPQNETE